MVTSNRQTQPASRRVAIAGATGLVGQYILQNLLAEGNVSEVHVLCRRDLGVRHPKLTEHRVDFTALPKLPSIDEVYLALGTTIEVAGSQAAFRAVDFEATLEVTKAALVAGARRVALVSAVGANAHSNSFYSRVKGELEEAMTQLSCDTLLIARPSLLLGDRAALGQPARRAERAAIEVFGRLSWLFPSSLRPISAQRVAEVLVKKLPTIHGKQLLTSADLHKIR